MFRGSSPLSDTKKSYFEIVNYSKMNITKEELDIYNAKLKKALDNKTKEIELVEGDRVFIYSNAKVKKREFNKIIKKYKDVKRTYDFGEANVIIFPDVSSNYYYFNQRYEYNGNNYSTWQNKIYLSRYIYEHDKDYYSQLFPNKTEKEIIEYIGINDFDKKVKLVIKIQENYKDINASHFKKIIKDDIRVYHEYSTQTLVFNETIDSKENVADYNTDMLIELLANEKVNVDLAITMLKQCNIKEDAYKLLLAYKQGKMSYYGREMFFKHIIYGHPKLALKFPLQKYASRMNYISDVRIFIADLDSLGYDYDVDVIINDFFNFSSNSSDFRYTEDINRLFILLDKNNIEYDKKQLICNILKLDNDGKLINGNSNEHQ